MTTKNTDGKTKPFKAEYCELAFNYSSLGATREQLAQFFGIDEETLAEWNVKYPKFQNSIKRGQLLADAGIANSLYRRAVGYSHPDTHVSNYQGEIIQTEITKHHPPDVLACIFWLCNRQPKLWKNVTGIEFEQCGNID